LAGSVVVGRERAPLSERARSRVVREREAVSARLGVVVPSRRVDVRPAAALEPLLLFSGVGRAAAAGADGDDGLVDAEPLDDSAFAGSSACFCPMMSRNSTGVFGRMWRLRNSTSQLVRRTHPLLEA
jgi:hypothetical protein